MKIKVNNEYYTIVKFNGVPIKNISKINRNNPYTEIETILKTITH